MKARMTLNPVLDIESGKLIQHDGQTTEEVKMQCGGGPGPDWTPDDVVTSYENVTVAIRDKEVVVEIQGKQSVTISRIDGSVVQVKH